MACDALGTWSGSGIFIWSPSFIPNGLVPMTWSTVSVRCDVCCSIFLVSTTRSASNKRTKCGVGRVSQIPEKDRHMLSQSDKVTAFITEIEFAKKPILVSKYSLDKVLIHNR